MSNTKSRSYPTTPDGRYFIVKGRLWRCTDPSIPHEKVARLQSELSAARRGLRASELAKNPGSEPELRSKVHHIKVALGERGNVWWDDGARDYTRFMVKNTPYAHWYSRRDCQESHPLS